jgi:diacylglycerol kinase family enzyme
MSSVPFSVLVFANPISGLGRGAGMAERVKEELVRRGYRVGVFLNKADSIEWCAAGQEIRAVVVIGGDGTVRGVARWAMEQAWAEEREDCGLERAPWPLVVVPTGTANLMARHLGIRWDEQRVGEEVAEALEERWIVGVDAGRMGDEMFLLMVGVGFEAWVIQEMARTRRGPIRLASYLPLALKGLGEYRFAELRVEVDGRCVFEGAGALAMVGNVAEHGLGFPVAPLARGDDGMLDVCVMPCGSRMELVRLFLAAAGGRHVGEEGVVYVKGKRIRIESEEAVAVQMDGEAAGFTPVEIDLLPVRIPFIVPRRI